MKRLAQIIIVILAAACVAVSVPIGGRRIVGFDYRAVVDTEFTICPDRVVGQSTNVITLATGEKFRVRGVQPEELTSMLLRSNAYVRVDRTDDHYWLSIRRPGTPCGMRPERNQWITIPLRATERVQTYHAEEVGEVEVVGGGGGG
jgi:hypothetical protein